MNLRLAIAVGLLLSLPLCAASVVTPPCVPGTLADYIALGARGCEIGGTVFANFGYAIVVNNVPVPPANQILVTPLAMPAEAILAFSANWAAAAGETQESVISYTIMPNPAATAGRAGTLILQLGPAKVNGIIGSATVQESTNVGNLTVYLQCNEVCSEKALAQLLFSPVTELKVSDNVTIVGGDKGASLSSFNASIQLCQQVCPL